MCFLNYYFVFLLEILSHLSNPVLIYKGTCHTDCTKYPQSQVDIKRPIWRVFQQTQPQFVFV